MIITTSFSTVVPSVLVVVASGSVVSVGGGTVLGIVTFEVSPSIQQDRVYGSSSAWRISKLNSKEYHRFI